MNVIMRIFHFLSFFFFYIKEVILSNIAISIYILTPGFKMNPAVVEVPLKARKEIEVIFLANLISMTPGSLTLDYNPVKGSLKVHVMNYSDPVDLQRLMDKMQDKIIKIFE